MAVDMFLKIEGPELKGESRDAKHSGEIDVLAWSWGVSNSGTTHMGGGSGAGKANFQDLSVTCYFDLSATELIKATSQGTHYDKATLVCRKAGGTALEYILLTMEDCLITSVSTGGSGGEERLTLNFSINFGKFTIQYREQDEKGGKKSEPLFSYNIAENEAA